MRITEFVMKLVTVTAQTSMVVLNTPQGFEAFEFDDEKIAARFAAINEQLVLYRTRKGERLSSCSDPRAIPF